MRLRLASLGGGAVAAVVLILAIVSGASAHAKVTVVEWDNTTNPTKVTATAVEEIAATPGTFSLKVFNSSDVEVDHGDTTIDPNDATKMSVSVNANLPVGIYRVDWATVSAEDGDAANDSLDLPLGVTITPSPTPPPHKSSVTVTLSALNGSGVSGTATVSEADDGDTQIAVSLTGLQAGTTHIEHVHMGATCSANAADLGDHLVDLSDLTVDSTGHGTSDTDADIAYLDVANGANKLVVHAGPDASTDANKVPIACGTIPTALTTAASPTHTPAGVPSTGGQPGDSSTPWLVLLLAGALLSALGGAGLMLARRKR
jgi:methionine-rich copper-binding protein CopC